jgi:hypothetical protein
MKIVKPFFGPSERELLEERLTEALMSTGGYIEEEIHQVMDESVRVLMKTANPAGTYTLVPLLGISRKGIMTKAGQIASPKFAHLAVSCEDARFIIFSVATLGAEFDSEISRDMPLFKKLILDTAGSVLAEMIAGQVEEEWRKELNAAGLESSMRISPGYCDWSLRGQAVVFNAIDTRSLGIELLPSFVMMPKKSISSVALAARRVSKQTPCSFCCITDCRWRRIAHTH